VNDLMDAAKQKMIENMESDKLEWDPFREPHVLPDPIVKEK